MEPYIQSACLSFVIDHNQLSWTIKQICNRQQLEEALSDQLRLRRIPEGVLLLCDHWDLVGTEVLVQHLLYHEVSGEELLDVPHVVEPRFVIVHSNLQDGHLVCIILEIIMYVLWIVELVSKMGYK